MKCFGVFILIALAVAVFAEDVPQPPRTLTIPPRCRQPIDRGDASCSEDLDKYGYDVNEAECVRFTYTGCGGNSNRFDTLSACRATCA